MATKSLNNNRNHAWVSKLQTAQNDNYLSLKRVVARLDEEVCASSDPRAAQAKAKDIQHSMNQQLKKYHAHISKCAKRMESFCDDHTRADIPRHDGLSSKADPYMKLCLDHLCLSGKRETVCAFVEQDQNSALSTYSQYMDDIYGIIQSIQTGEDLHTAEDWIFENLKADRINELAADMLTYAIMKLKFLALLTTAHSSGSSQKYSEALEISKVMFPLFYVKDMNTSELNEMMCCLLFVKADKDTETPSFLPQASHPTNVITLSPWIFMYPHLSITEAIQQACAKFRAVAAEAHGLSPTSALHSLLLQGVAAASFLSVSSLSFAAGVDQQKSWMNLDHVCFPSLSSPPVGATDDPSIADMRTVSPWAVAEPAFHSILNCPVSREMATPENLPVLLQCGHVVLSSSMKSLPSTRSGRFKCPTCYHEMKQNGCMVLYL